MSHDSLDFLDILNKTSAQVLYFIYTLVHKHTYMFLKIFIYEINK